jgi:N-ethylmaleimide reductase
VLISITGGVQILANYLYLISQFLNAKTNLRKDEYGGSLENRSRFLFEVVESVLSEVDSQKVGVKISPMHEGGAFQANDETLPVTEYAIQRLSTYDLSHLLLFRTSESPFVPEKSATYVSARSL